MILNLYQLEAVLLILARIAGIFVEAPVLNSRTIPALAKSGIAIWLAVVLWFVTPLNQTLPNSLLGFVLALIFEMAIGFTIGFICNIIFIAIQSAGEIMDLQMGLSVATALDPVFGSVISIVGRITFYLALIVFITADGHHMLLSALHQSFKYLPVGRIANFSSPDLILQIVGTASSLWLIAIKLAAPIVLLIFLSDFSFGIVSRVAPQVNVFMLGFQVKPLLGVFGIMVTLPYIVKYIDRLVELMAGQLMTLANIIK